MFSMFLFGLTAALTVNQNTELKDTKTPCSAEVQSQVIILCWFSLWIHPFTSDIVIFSIF